MSTATTYQPMSHSVCPRIARYLLDRQLSVQTWNVPRNAPPTMVINHNTITQAREVIVSVDGQPIGTYEVVPASLRQAVISYDTAMNTLNMAVQWGSAKFITSQGDISELVSHIDGSDNDSRILQIFWQFWLEERGINNTSIQAPENLFNLVIIGAFPGLEQVSMQFFSTPAGTSSAIHLPLSPEILPLNAQRNEQIAAILAILRNAFGPGVEAISVGNHIYFTDIPDVDISFSNPETSLVRHEPASKSYIPETGLALEQWLSRQDCYIPVVTIGVPNYPSPCGAGSSFAQGPGMPVPLPPPSPPAPVANYQFRRVSYTTAGQTTFVLLDGLVADSVEVEFATAVLPRTPGPYMYYTIDYPSRTVTLYNVEEGEENLGLPSNSELIIKYITA